MRKYLFLFIIAFFAANFSHAATFTSFASGNFNVPGNWTVVGADADGIPDADDDVIISNTHTITLVASSNMKTLTTNSGGLFKLNSFALVVWGNLTNNGNITGSGSIQFRAPGTFSGAHPVTPTGTLYFFSSYTIAPGSILSVTGSATISSGATVTNRGQMLFSGTCTFVSSTSTFINASGSVVWFGASPSATGVLDASAASNNVLYYLNGSSTIKTATYYNLILNNATATRTLGGNITVLHDLTIGTSTTLNWANHNITLGGNWTNNGNFTGLNMGTITFNGSGTQVVTKTTGPEVYQNMNVSGTGTVQMGRSIVVNGTFTLNSGTLDVSASNFTLTVSRNFVHNGGVFNPRNGNVALNGNVAQQINGFTPTTFYNLTSSNTAGGVTVNSAITISNILTVNTTSFNANLAANGTVTIPATGNTTYGRIGTVGATASLTGSGWIVKCFINGPAARNWQYLGSPMSGNNLSDWDNDTRFYMSGIGGNDGNACCPIFYSVRTYNAASATWTNVTTNGTALTPCKGFSVWMADNNTAGLSAPLIFDSRGTPNFGNKSIAMTGNAYNLVSNPYACPVTYSAVQSASTNASATFLCWSESGSYVTSPNGGTIAGTQGFMVFASAAGTLNFTEACKSLVANPNVIRQGDPQNYLRIRSSNDVNGLGGEAVVQISNDAVNGYDQMDLPFIASMFEDATNIWTTDAAGQDQLLNAIDGSQDNLDIPLTVAAGTAGNQMVYFSGLNGFSEYSCATLEDLTTGQKVNLKEKDNYTYFADVLGDKRNFILHLSRNGECPLNEQNLVPSLDAQSLVFVSNNQLMAKFNFEENTNVEISIFDVDGRQVSDTQNMTVASESVVLPTPNAHGIYFVRITSGDRTSTKKIYY